MIKRGVLIFSAASIIILLSLVSFVAAQDDNGEKNIIERFIDWVSESLGRVGLGPRGGVGDSSTQYRVFVSSINYTGGQLSNGDSKCQQLAQQAGLSGTWKAWLSTSAKDAKSKISNAKYVRLDGLTVANSKADLLDGSLQNPINVNEYGVELPLSICDSPTCDLAYTGTKPDGTRSSGFMCDDWTSESVEGKVGYFHSISGEWTAVGNVSCVSKQRIYCFEVSTTGKIVANNSNPTQKTHLACSNLACTPVSGTGTNTCATNADCSHLACVSNSCTLVAGVGTDECTPQGSSCGSSVIEVCTPQDLDNVRNNLNGNYLQVCDIDLAGYNFEPIGDINNPFTGNYNGQIYKISNLKITNLQNGQYAGLFGVINGSTLNDIKLYYASIISSASDVIAGSLIGASYNGHIGESSSFSPKIILPNHGTGAGLVGVLYGGEIVYSFVNDGLINVSEEAGGLVVGSLGNIYRSYAHSTIFSEEEAGGLVGENFGNITDSYSRGFVRGAQAVGGLVGENLGGNAGNGKIINSYSSTIVSYLQYSNLSYYGGLVGGGFNSNGLVINSYWDKDISGFSNSYGGQGLTTKDMVKKISYQNWDFNDIWDIKDKKTYPWLRGFSGIDLNRQLDYKFDFVNVNNLTPDESQYARHGHVNGIEIINSIRGNVARFGNGDYVRINAGNFNVTKNSDFKVDFWMKLDKNTNETGQPVQTILSNGIPGYYPGFMVFVNPQNRLVAKFHYANNNTALIQVPSTIILQKNIWYHIEIFMFPTELEMHINEQLENEAPIPFGFNPYSPTFPPFSIGADNVGEGYTPRWFYNGALDDFKVYHAP